MEMLEFVISDYFTFPRRFVVEEKIIQIQCGSTAALLVVSLWW